jgi:hypothetical protein
MAIRTFFSNTSVNEYLPPVFWRSLSAMDASV